MKKKDDQSKHPKGKTQWWKHLRPYFKRVVNKSIRKYWKNRLKKDKE